MRKVLVNIFFLAVCVLLWTASASAESTTLMIYMCGSNLESLGGAATTDIQEMLASGFDADQVQVILLTGGCAQWQNIPAFANDRLSLYTARKKATGGVKLKPLSTVEGRSMGDADTLTWFLRTGMEYSETERYALILWDHGEGPLGSVCLDELNDLDGLTLKELTEALENAGLQKKLSWIGFDACLMGSAEVALAVAPYAEYMIASQETEPANGWNYAFLKDLEKDADGAATGKRIVDAYFSGKNATEYGITLSCIDLDAVGGLADGMSRFFGPITDKLDANSFASLSELRTASTNFGRAKASVSENGYDLVDLRDLVRHYQTLGDTTELESVIDSAVIYNRSNSKGANGLSVYHALYNKNDYLAKWREFYSSLPFSKGYQSYLSLFGSILTGGALTDWTDIRLEDDGFSPLLENLFHVRLAPEQRESVVSAQLLVLGSLPGKDSSSLYEMQLPTSGDNPNYRKMIYYYPVWNADIERRDGAELDFRYGGQSIYVTDENGKAIAGPVSYSLSEDGTEWYIHALYQDHSGRQTNAPDADVLFTCTLDETSGRLSIVKTEVYDSVTQTYTRRLAFSEDDYTRMLVDRCAKTLPNGEGALPGFDAWQDQSLFLELSLPLKWNLQVIGEQLSGTPLYATVQITDAQQNSWCTPLIRLQNPNLYDIDILPRTISGDGYEATLYAVMDNSELTPGLSISMEVTNTTNIDTAFKVDGFILNGKRSAFGEDRYSSIYISAKAGEIGYDACRISADQLWDLDEIREISFTMEAQKYISREPLHIEYDEIPVDLAISGCEIAAFENKPAHPLSTAETDGVRWELVSLSPSIQGGLDAIVHIENGGSEELVYTAASLGINGVLQISYGNDLSIRVLPATDAYLHFRIRDYVEFEKASLHIQGRTSRTYLGDYQLLEQFGITEIDKLQLFYSINNNACPVMFELDRPIAVGTSDAWVGMPMEDRFAAAMKDAPLLTGDVNVAVDQVLVADNGIGIRYLIRNQNDQDIILNIGNPKIDDRESYSFERVFNLGAHTTMLAMQEVSFSSFAPNGLQVSDIGVTFRYDGYTTNRAHIRLPEDTRLGRENGLYLSAAELATAVRRHPPVGGTGIIPVACSSDSTGVDLAIVIGNEKDDYLAPDDYWDNPTKLQLCFTVHINADEQIKTEFCHLMLNQRVVEAYCNHPYGSNKYIFDIDRSCLTNMEELRSVSCVLMETRGYGRSKSIRETDLSWALDGFDLTDLSPVIEKTLGSGETAGLQCQLLSLKTYPSDWNDYGKLDFQLLCKNEGDTRIDLKDALLTIKGINPQSLGRNLYGTCYLDPHTEQLFKLTYTNTADEEDYSSFSLEDGNRYGLPFEGRLLQCAGIETVREISVLFKDGASESEYQTISIPIDDFRLPEATGEELSDYAAAKPILDGAVSVRASYLLVGGKEFAVTLIMKNDSDRVRTLLLSGAEAEGNKLRFGLKEALDIPLLPHTTQVKTVVMSFAEEAVHDEAVCDFKISFTPDGEAGRVCVLRSGFPLFLGNRKQISPAHIQVLAPEDARPVDVPFTCSIGMVISDHLGSHYREITSLPYEEDLRDYDVFAPALLISDYAPDTPPPAVYLEVNGQPTYFDRYDIGQYSRFWYYNPSVYSGPGSYACVAYVNGVECCSQTIEVGRERPRNPIPLKSAHTDDLVLYGAYEQDGDPDNGKESIEWLVLDEDGDSLLLLSRYALESRPYLPGNPEDCDLPAWLNTSFVDEAFSPEELAGMLPGELRGGGEETPADGAQRGRDKVFLLSKEELTRCYPEWRDRRRICYLSAHAGKASSVYASASKLCNWWLRSPAQDKFECMNIACEASDMSGEYAAGVRPAIRVQREKPAIEEGKSSFTLSSQDFSEEYDCAIIFVSVDRETDKLVAELNVSELSVQDFLGDERLALILNLKNKSAIPLAPELSAFQDGEQGFYDQNILQPDKYRFFRVDLPDGPGEHDVVFYNDEKKLCEVRYCLLSAASLAQADPPGREGTEQAESRRQSADRSKPVEWIVPSE